MNQKQTRIALAAAALTLGLSMPSCPGQQAMQQQIDTLQGQTNSLNAKVTGLTNQLKASGDELAKLRDSTNQTLSQMTATIQAQDSAIKNLEGTVKLMEQMKAAPSKKKGKKH